MKCKDLFFSCVYLSRCEWDGQEVAVKLFRSDTSPDGHCKTEIAISLLLCHSNLPRVLATVHDQSGKVVGLLMPLLRGGAMADRPDGVSVLRCRWEQDTSFSESFVLKVGMQVASALHHLHRQHYICHGDIYAHNIVIDQDSGNACLLDFGASFHYDPKDQVDFQRLEVRAYGLFLQDLLLHIRVRRQQQSHTSNDPLMNLVKACICEEVRKRPEFAEIVQILTRTMQGINDAHTK